MCMEWYSRGSIDLHLQFAEHGRHRNIQLAISQAASSLSALASHTAIQQIEEREREREKTYLMPMHILGPLEKVTKFASIALRSSFPTNHLPGLNFLGSFQSVSSRFTICPDP